MYPVKENMSGFSLKVMISMTLKEGKLGERQRKGGREGKKERKESRGEGKRSRKEGRKKERRNRRRMEGKQERGLGS